MTKKLTFTLAAIISTISLTVFSLANAFALEGSDQSSQAITSVKQLCKDLKANMKDEVKSIKSKGLSGPYPLTQEEIDKQVQDHRDYIKLACEEAKDAAKLCKKLRKEYKQKVDEVKAQGLPKEEEDSSLAKLKAEKKAACNKIVTLTSPVKMCNEFTKSLATKAQSSSLSEEEMKAWLAEEEKYKKKICKEAATDKKYY